MRTLARPAASRGCAAVSSLARLRRPAAAAAAPLPRASAALRRARRAPVPAPAASATPVEGSLPQPEASPSADAAAWIAAWRQRLSAPENPAPAAAEAAAPAASAVAAAVPAKGAKLLPALLSVGVGLAVRFLVPLPAGVSSQAWSLLAIFLSTITGLVLEPLPVGAWAFLGLTAAVATRTLTFAAAFSAFTSDVIWLIVISFFFARGFVKTGLGDRVATHFVARFGASTLGLSYGLVLAEAAIAPAMPSTTARAGGVFLPIIRSLAQQAGSEPGTATASTGAFLCQSQLQCAAHSSALFLTAAAQNLLALKLAAEVVGAPLPGSAFTTWFVAAAAPAFIALALTPALVYRLLPPGVRSTPLAPAAARSRLAALGPTTADENTMLFVLGAAVGLWVFGDALGVPPVLAAMLALCALLATGVLSWQDCLGERSAWDTLLWFSVLVGMSGQLSSLGLVGAAAGAASGALAATGLGWQAVAALVNAAYFGAHYLFASQVAHVGALLAAALAVMLAAGCPPALGVLSLAFTTNLFGGITHYSSGQAAVYYGAGYTGLGDTLRVGAACGLLNLAVWGLAGGVWWKLLGLY